MKTAIQDLIDELKQFKKFPMVDEATIQAAIEFAELRLELNKQQIIDAKNDKLYPIENGGQQYFDENYSK
jgi:hypothetical protein